MPACILLVLARSADLDYNPHTPVSSIHLAHDAGFIPLDESRECLESIALDGTAILGQL